ncbi:MAG: hypothetical protein H7X89_16055 [Rhizobiales bacterium]|nr:hypothetical protein [Hyphomicrobiales bacterium]
MKLRQIALIAALAGALATPAAAEWRGSGKPQTAAKQAEYECAAMYYGSGRSIAATIIGGAIGNAVGRSMFINDCMKERGFQKVAGKKPARAAGHAQPKEH